MQESTVGSLLIFKNPNFILFFQKDPISTSFEFSGVSVGDLVWCIELGIWNFNLGWSVYDG